MASLKDRVAAAIAGFKGAKGKQAGRMAMQIPNAKRSYAGAQWDRLTEDFLSPLTTGDAEMKTRLRTLRGRARELERNEPYTRRFLSRLEDNIYDHHGITFNSLAGNWMRDPKTKKTVFRIDDEDAAVIEAAYTKWRKNPFVTNDMTMNEGGRLALRCTARDGDTLIRFIVDPSINEFGFALQLFEGDIIDDMRNELTRGANGKGIEAQVRMGVEVDEYMKAIAYWMLKEYPGDQQWWHAEGFWSERYDASGFIHPYKKTRITQVRDTTWLCGIMRDLKMLDGYDEAAIVAARTGAAKMGFFTRAFEAPGPGYQGENADGQRSMDAEAGLIEDLSGTPGMDFKAWDPAYPHEQYEPFIKTRLRRIGAGLDMSYYAIANDLTEVNFSSIRAGLLEDRERFKAQQSWWISRFEQPIFLRWLEISLLNGSLKSPASGQTLPFSKLNKFQEHRFRPRRWPWVDPEKDANASKIAVDNRFKSRSQVIEETSEATFEEVIREQGAEQELAESEGVELPPAADAPPSPQEPDADDAEATARPRADKKA